MAYRVYLTERDYKIVLDEELVHADTYKFYDGTEDIEVPAKELEKIVELNAKEYDLIETKASRRYFCIYKTENSDIISYYLVFITSTNGRLPYVTFESREFKEIQNYMKTF